MVEGSRSRMHWRMLQCRIQAKPAGLHFWALFPVRHVHTDGQKVKRGGLGPAPGRGEQMLQVNIKPASICPYSVADPAAREELKQRGGGGEEERPSASCPPRSQRAAPPRCQQQLPGSAARSATLQPRRYEMSCDAWSAQEESFPACRMRSHSVIATQMTNIVQNAFTI